MNGRKFVHVSSGNSLDSNLTELNATSAVNNGFVNHPDWLAHVMRYAVVMEYAKKSGKKNILDVGCGNFPMLTYLWRNRTPLDDMKYVGIDLRAREQWLQDGLPEKVDIELYKMDIIADDSSVIEPADIVVCTEMLEHIDKIHAPELLRRLRKWTNDDGMMFLSSPNLGGSDTVASNHTDANGKPREWTYEGKCKLIEGSGFEIVEATGTFIRLDRLPAEFMNKHTRDIKKKLPNPFFRVFAAAAFPEFANNVMFTCKPV
jgi:2-polyprenyl-3-methyl-5-hydroxy-6-metoxy-1,4-benzoquinol methylase